MADNDDKKTSQENVNFLNILEKRIEDTENGHNECFVIQGRASIVYQSSDGDKKCLKDWRYKEDYIKFTNKICNTGFSCDELQPWSKHHGTVMKIKRWIQNLI